MSAGSRIFLERFGLEVGSDALGLDKPRERSSRRTAHNELVADDVVPVGCEPTPDVATSVVNPGRGKSANADLAKVSMVQFARLAGTTDTRVKRHLDAWNRAAEKGLCTPSADLSPEDATDPDLMVPGEDDEQFEAALERRRLMSASCSRLSIGNR